MVHRVLYADGDPVVRGCRCQALCHAGFEAIEAASGAEALKLISEKRPAVAIVAIGMDGIALCRRIKADPRIGAIPVLHIGNAGESHRGYAESLESGADGWLDEPVDAATLIEVAKALLRKAGAAPLPERTLTALIDNMPDEVWFTDVNGRFAMANPAARREFLIGHDLPIRVEELTGNLEIYRSDGTPRPLDESPALNALAGKTVRMQEEIIRNPRSREMRYRQVSASPVRDMGGRIMGSVSVVRDITDRKRAEQALRESETAYRTLFENMLNGVIHARLIFDGDRVVDYVNLAVNAAYKKLTGLTDTVGKRVTEYRPNIAENEPWFFESCGRVARTGVGETAEVWIATAKEWVSYSVYKLGVDEVVIVFEVITERKRFEEVLRESEARFRDLFERAPVAYHELDRDGVIRRANRAACELQGVDERHIVGRPAWDFVMAAEREEARKAVLLRLSGEAAPKRNQSRIVRGDGEVRWVEVHHALVRNSAGEITGLRSASLDVTKLRKAQAELEADRRRLAESQRVAQLGSWTIELPGLQLTWSEETYHLMGVSRETFLPTVDQFFSWIHPADISAMREWTRACIAAENPSDIEFGVKLPDGTHRIFRVRGVLVRGAEGQAVRMTGTCQDITELKRAEEQRAQLEAEFHQAQKMESIGHLAGGIAHDFNNMLAVINGYSQLLLNDSSTSECMRDSLSEIHKAGKRASGLTKQLLAFSRRQVLQPCRLDLNRLLAGLRPMLERMVKEDIQLEFVPAVGSAIVHADPHQLEQVIMNLVVNARDAMPDAGTLLIKTSNVERGEPAPGRRYVMLAVKDTGVGMDEETKSRIFEPFFTTKGVGEGTGLGLSMVHGVVAQSGGYIEVQSEKGAGSTFEIYLPGLAGEPEPDATPATGAAAGGTETVLVVEDQRSVRKYAAKALKKYGYRVISAESGEEALRLCERAPVDLVVTDVVMPKLSGRELADRLEVLKPGIKVLFMSGYTGSVIERHGILQEGMQFIQKPFNPEELASKVRSVLGPPAEN
jgi:two-component system, cell cycle sensor histidine kinase and response regulator CckA